MGYLEYEIIQKCDAAWRNIPAFYQEDCINYRGKTTDTNRLYSEVVAEYVLNRMEEFKNSIPAITRGSSYAMVHDGSFREGTGRDEEIIAIKMFNQSQNGTRYAHIGKIIDYQTPLKNTRDDKAGKIDLLSFDGDTLRILELKKPDSKETMLRCVLEGYTYLQTVDQAKLKRDFGIPQEVKVAASPFVFYGKLQYEEWKEDRQMLLRLMAELGSVPYFVEEQSGKYIVREE